VTRRWCDTTINQDAQKKSWRKEEMREGEVKERRRSWRKMEEEGRRRDEDNNDVAVGQRPSRQQHHHHPFILLTSLNYNASKMWAGS